MLTWQTVLKYKYSPNKPVRATVRPFYDIWRSENNIPLRCDNNKCQFYTAPRVWNGKPFILVLDHIEGNRYDNHPRSLRYLCPNGDSQLDTRGGGNKGRLTNMTENGYRLKKKDGRTIAASTGRTHGSSKVIGRNGVK
jgi:hypothetical protein